MQSYKTFENKCYVPAYIKSVVIFHCLKTWEQTRPTHDNRYNFQFETLYHNCISCARYFSTYEHKYRMCREVKQTTVPNLFFHTLSKYAQDYFHANSFFISVKVGVLQTKIFLHFKNGIWIFIYLNFFP